MSNNIDDNDDDDDLKDDNNKDNDISLNRETEYKKKYANGRLENPRFTHDKNKVRDGREINHMHQLSRVDKELVKVIFREAYLKCWRMDQIPTYILLKTKINVTRKLVDSIKERQWDDDRFWFYELARDPVAYLGLYRDAIDKLTQLEKEMWVIVMNSKIETVPRIMAVREIHSIQKTMVLMLRDLPFITNLSKLYDINSLDPAGKTLKKLQKAQMYPNRSDRNPDYEQKKTLYKSVNDPRNSNLLQTVMEKNIPDIVNGVLQGGRKKGDNGRDSDDGDKRAGNDVMKVDSDVVQDMKDQLDMLGTDFADPELAMERERERKEAEERYLRENMKKLEDEEKNASTEEEKKVVELKKQYVRKMASIDSLISREQWKDIEKIRGLTEEDEDEEDDKEKGIDT